MLNIIIVSDSIFPQVEKMYEKDCDVGVISVSGYDKHILEMEK